MPKLLDYISEKELSHAKVIEILENHLKESPEPEPEEESEEEEETDEEEESQEQGDESEEEQEEKPEIIKLSKNDLQKIVKEAVEERLKAVRKPPSKAKPVKKSLLKDRPALTKAMFERKV